jgi:hypothetical protein
VAVSLGLSDQDTLHLHIVWRLRIHEDVFPLPHAFLWRGASLNTGTPLLILPVNARLESPNFLI